MSYNYGVVRVLENRPFNRVTAYGFYTREAAEEEKEECEAAFGDESYEVIRYENGLDVKLYHLPEQQEFARTLTGAEDMALD